MATRRTLEALELKVSAREGAEQPSIAQRIALLRDGCQQKEALLGKNFAQFKKKCERRYQSTMRPTLSLYIYSHSLGLAQMTKYKKF